MTTRKVDRSPLAMMKLLILRIVAMAAVVGCTFIAYGVYMVVSGSAASSALWDAYTEAMGAAGAVFGMDPIVASLIVPAFITSSLAMGVVLYMHKKS